MRALLLLLLVSSLGFAQDPFDGAPYTDSTYGMREYLTKYLTETYIPATKSGDTDPEVQFEIAEKMHLMIQAFQEQLVDDLDSGKIDLYEFSEHQNGIACNLILMTWYAQGIDQALAKLMRMTMPVKGTNFEVAQLEFGLNLIFKSLPKSSPQEVDYLTKIVNHSQFMKDDSPGFRSNQAYRLLRLAKIKVAAGAYAEANNLIDTYLQKIQTCDCANYDEVVDALALNNQLPSTYRTPMSSTFYSWYDQLALNPLGPSRHYTEAEIAAYRAQMSEIIQMNLNKYSVDQ